jgi:hypothetical protein
VAAALGGGAQGVHDVPQVDGLVSLPHASPHA